MQVGQELPIQTIDCQKMLCSGTFNLREFYLNAFYCQLVCPWTRFSNPSSNQDFQPRHSLDNAALTDLFSWSESQFYTRLEGSPIRRIGYQRWLRNIAVALGNSTKTTKVLTALEIKKAVATPMVREHIEWAIARLNNHSAKAD